MPKITIHGFDSFLKGLGKGLDEYTQKLSEGYKKAIEEVSPKIARDAVTALGKPNWELSKSISASKLKVYENRHVIFQATEPKGNLNPLSNTPGSYAFYQEHGWFVDTSKVKRKRAGSMVTKRGRKTATAYRKQRGKEFFKRAFDSNSRSLFDKVEQVNKQVLLEIKE